MSARKGPRNGRRLLAAGAAALVIGLPGFGAAQANAAEVRVLDSCVATVHDGEHLALNPAAVQQPIIDLLNPLDPLHVLVPAFRNGWAGQQPILLPGGQAVIAGDQIATAVIDRLRGISALAPVIDVLAQPVRTVLSAGCRVTVTPGPPAAPPPGGTPPAGGAPKPGTPAPGSLAPGIPADVPGSAATLLPGYVVGAVPGVPGEGGLPPDGIAYNYDSSTVPQQSDADRLALSLARSAGTAEVLPGEGGARLLDRPVMLATLLLTLVGTQLLRVWVLRRPGSRPGK